MIMHKRGEPGGWIHEISLQIMSQARHEIYTKKDQEQLSAKLTKVVYT